MRGRRALAVALAVLISIGGAYVLLRQGSSSGCPPFQSSPVVKTQASSKAFGAITTFALPTPDRRPNAVAVAPDGSVWFGEEAVAGLAHLYPTNGTLVEYSFPGTYQTNPAVGFSCADKTDIWGVALWDGRVWATDSAQNRLVGLSPTNDTFKVVPLSTNDSLPYTLTPGPDNTLWFTQINSGQIGTLYANGTVAEHSVTVPEHLNGTSVSENVPGVPAQLAFASASLGYYVDASPLISGSPVFAFDPAHFSAQQVGAGNQSLADPDSLSLGQGGIWLAQHGDSSLALENPEDGSLAIYPTSTVGYIATTLPYFVETNGSLVWFNEHFGNRMAALDVPNGTLTEYSLSDPAASNMSQIDNALTFALGGGRAWFAESTADAIGFVDASYRPSFSVSAEGSPSLSVTSGGSASLQVGLSGSSSTPLSIQFSDSALQSSAGTNITMRADRSVIGSLSGNQSVNVTVDVGSGTAPGRYTLLVTASDGLISRSIYIDLSVLQ